MDPGLHTGELDILVGSRPAGFITPAISSEILLRDQIGIVVRRGHPLLAKRKLALKDLTDFQWILPSESHTFTKSCLACFSSAGLRGPSPAVVATSAPFIDAIVSATDFLTFMSVDLVTGTQRAETMTQLKMPGGVWDREIFLFSRNGKVLPPAPAALVDELRSAAGQGGRL